MSYYETPHLVCSAKLDKPSKVGAARLGRLRAAARRRARVSGGLLEQRRDRGVDELARGALAVAAHGVGPHQVRQRVVRREARGQRNGGDKVDLRASPFGGDIVLH